MPPRDHVRYVLEQWRRELPALDRSPFAVVGRISRLAQLLQDEIEPLFEAHGLTGGEFDVLAALRREGPPYQLTPSELGAALIVTSGGMTKRLNALEDRGLVRRQPHPHDGRSIVVSLTRDGRRLFEAILPEHSANERRLVGGLSATKRAELARLLESFAVALGDTARGATPDAARRSVSKTRKARRRRPGRSADG